MFSSWAGVVHHCLWSHIPTIAPLSQERAPIDLGDRARHRQWSALVCRRHHPHSQAGAWRMQARCGRWALPHLLPHHEALASLPTVIREGGEQDLACLPLGFLLKSNHHFDMHFLSTYCVPEKISPSISTPKRRKDFFWALEKLVMKQIFLNHQ